MDGLIELDVCVCVIPVVLVAYDTPSKVYVNSSSCDLLWQEPLYRAVDISRMAAKWSSPTLYAFAKG